MEKKKARRASLCAWNVINALKNSTTRDSYCRTLETNLKLLYNIDAILNCLRRLKGP